MACVLAIQGPLQNFRPLASMTLHGHHFLQMDPDHQECHLKWPESWTFELVTLKGIKNALQSGITVGVLDFWPTPRVPNGEKFMDKAYKSIKYSHLCELVHIKIDYHAICNKFIVTSRIFFSMPLHPECKKHYPHHKCNLSHSKNVIFQRHLCWCSSPNNLPITLHHVCVINQEKNITSNWLLILSLVQR